MDGTNDLRINELILAVNTGQLGPNGLSLVADCARFLMLDMKRKHAARKGILEFVHEFCKVPGHAGYDYLVLAFLEFEGLMNHGCSCRYGWLDGPLCDLLDADDDADVGNNTGTLHADGAAACVSTKNISADAGDAGDAGDAEDAEDAGDADGTATDADDACFCTRKHAKDSDSVGVSSSGAGIAVGFDAASPIQRRKKDSGHGCIPSTPSSREKKSPSTFRFTAPYIRNAGNKPGPGQGRALV